MALQIKFLRQGHTMMSLTIFRLPVYLFRFWGRAPVRIMKWWGWGWGSLFAQWPAGFHLVLKYNKSVLF